jgi:AcrR family transcriptional regulator
MAGKGSEVARNRRRLTQDETRALLIDYGATLLRTGGLTFGMELVSLEDAVRETGVSRTSAYRLWSADEQRSPQEAFKRDVLLFSLQRPSDTDVAQLSRLRDQLIESVLALDWSKFTDSMSAASAVAGLIMEYITENRSLTIYRTLQAVVASQPETTQDEELVRVLDTTDAQWRDALIEAVLRPMLAAFHLEPRFDVPVDVALEQVSVAVSAFITGLTLKTTLPSSNSILEKPLEDASDLRLGNAGLAALLLTFFKPRE